MPKVSEPPRFGLALEIPFLPGPLVCAASVTPPKAPSMAALAPSASPPARNDRRSTDCVIATPQGLGLHVVRTHLRCCCSPLRGRSLERLAISQVAERSLGVTSNGDASGVDLLCSSEFF